MMVTIPLSVIVTLLIIASGVLGWIGKWSDDESNILIGAISVFLVAVLAGIGGHLCG